MRIASWNINGLRSAVGKGLIEWLTTAGADVVGLQETRCREDQVPAVLRELDGWHSHYVCAERPGYSGVAMLSRLPFDGVDASLGQKSFDCEGRVHIARLGSLRIANVYFPNGSGQDRDNGRVPFKLKFYRKLFNVLNPLRKAGAPIVVMGDFNTAPHEIDLARPKDNKKTSGFLEEERDELARWFRAGWVDSFRHFHTTPHRYSWWSQRFGVRERNVGWRIDLALVSPGALPYLESADIQHDVMGSDHCPILLDLHDDVREAKFEPPLVPPRRSRASAPV